MCLARGYSTMTVVPRLGIEPGTLTTLPRRIPPAQSYKNILTNLCELNVNHLDLDNNNNNNNNNK